MKAEIVRRGDVLRLRNNRVEMDIAIDGRFKITRFAAAGSKTTLGAQQEQLVVFDRSRRDVSKTGSVRVASLKTSRLPGGKQGSGVRAVLTLCLAPEELKIERHIFLYDDAPAVRFYDVYSSRVPVAGLYYSDLLSFTFKKVDDFRLVDYFCCTDQSNQRLRESKLDAKGKGCLLVAENGTDSVFLYKEGPMPDSQPIKGEYDFVRNPDKAESVSLVGLGFDKLRPGERRRANGVVIGLAGDPDFPVGLRRYQQARYVVDIDNDIGYLANTWPAFHLDVTERKILGEIEMAEKLGVDTVFIDDGWFERFMGEVDMRKFPSGFSAVSKAARKAGVELGLWMNPFGLDLTDPMAKEWDGAECRDYVDGITWNSLARTNDFRSAEVVPSEGVRSYAAMDLMDDRYYQHIRGKILALHKTYGFKRFKFDLYQLTVFDTLLGDQHQHYERYREFLEDLQASIPGLVISMDITRRNRPCFDFGMDFGRLFLENRGRGLKDHRYYHPYITLGNLWSTAKYFPAQKIEVEMMPQIDDYPTDYVMATTLFGNPLYWGSLKELDAKKERDVTAFIKRFAPHKRRIMEGLILPIGDRPTKGSWSGFISLAPSAVGDAPAGYLIAYRNGARQRRHTFDLASLGLDGLTLRGVMAKDETVTCAKGGVSILIDEQFGFKLFTLQGGACPRHN